MSTNAQIEIVVNGEVRSIPEGQNLRQLLDFLAIDGSRVAVELDRMIVKPQSWDATGVNGGARLEIVHFVGGG